jgi:hypothetical protein
MLAYTPRLGDPSQWGVWNYAATLTCNGHCDAAEDEATAKQKHYRLIPIPLNAYRQPDRRHIGSHRSDVIAASPASRTRYSRTVRPRSHAARDSRRPSRFLLRQIIAG